jgi:hypothetical protein
MGIIKVGLKVGKLRVDSCGLGEGQAAGCGKECNEPSGSTKGGKLITFPRRDALPGLISHMCVCVCVCVCERGREG